MKNFQPTHIIHVAYQRGNTSVPVGRLALHDRKILFEYHPGFLELGFELSPFKLPLRPGIITCSDHTFEGLFGVFNDSLPDGWGRLLLDRKLMQGGIQPNLLTPLDRLQFVGTHGMGALRYEPELSSPLLKKIDDLDLLAAECLHVQEHPENLSVDDLLDMNGSSGGARPKILVHLTQGNAPSHASKNDTTVLHNEWIIKFRSSFDPIDIGPIEYAYHLMAKAALLDVPDARLFESKKCGGYFGVKRFDRTGFKNQHMHTASGLLHADYRLPSLDYEMILKATSFLTHDTQEHEKQFRNALFNVLAHNRDDHAKNFSFLMDENGIWRVSPAYDLTFSSGPGGEHCTMLMGEGKNITRSHFLKLAQGVSISQKKALTILNEVKAAVSNWSQFAQQAHVSSSSTQNIQAALSRVFKGF